MLLLFMTMLAAPVIPACLLSSQCRAGGARNRWLLGALEDGW
jgi:hypothetical protein